MMGTGRPLALTALVLAAVGTCGLGGALGQPRWTAPVEARIATDTVDIVLEDGGIEDGAVVVDDSTVPHSLSVVNHGSPCWVRVKTELVDREGAAATVTQAVAPTDRGSEVVVADDGYAYLTRPLEEDEAWRWEEAVGCRPDDLGLAYGEVRVVNSVEAIQRDHVEPRFEEGEPWGGIAAEKGIHTRYELNEGGER